VERLLHNDRHLSLETPINEGSETNFLDGLPSTTAPSREEAFINTTMTGDIRELLGQLPAREAHILRRRFGLDEEPNTLEAIGELRGITRERVRQIETQAKDRLRQQAKMRALHEYLN
jgi:RNA polymerase primary sigma factor